MPLSEGQVKVYSCGPTVYDFAHIGNLRAFIFADTLRRALEANGYKVSQVMNITDVGHLSSDADSGEDKLEKGAQREGKSVWDVAKHFTEAFLNDAKQLNILPPNAYKGSPDGYARATDFIEEQIAIIQLLTGKGYAYKTKQAIYFDVTKLADYGKLTGQKLADKEVAVRDEVVEDSDKHHPYDFAVWFFTVGRFKDHVMHWDSPWGPGFPGWHLECSAIIHGTLNEPIDIHTGGVDHIGTHHTNEIAQTEAAFGHELAHYWLHNEFVLVDGAKMSKSLGNFYRLKDITDKGFDPPAFRLLVLQAHYRSELNFTWESLEAAQSRLKSYQAFADLKWQAINPSKNDTLQIAQTAIEGLIGNDLATSQALAVLSTAITNTSQINDRSAFQDFLDFVDQLFGLGLADRPDISHAQKEILGQRDKARAANDWEKSDALRDQLIEHGIGVRDTDNGSVWFRL